VIDTIIIGARSNLSNELLKVIENSISCSSSDALAKITQFLAEGKRFNLILNQFQPAKLLNSIENLSSYVDVSISLTARIFDLIGKDPILVNKVIYTSSSSVYGSNPFCKEGDAPNPSNLHSSLKLANEIMVANYCKQKNIDYTVTRIFNLYGGNDNFSIISRIIKAYKESKILTLVNSGRGIRDFIHIKDAVYVYKILLTNSDYSVINIGSGKAQSIKDIIFHCKKMGKELQTKDILIDEIDVSASDNSKLREILPKDYKFESLFEYISHNL